MCIYIIVYIYIYGDELNPAQISYLYQRLMLVTPYSTWRIILLSCLLIALMIICPDSLVIQ